MANIKFNGGKFTAKLAQMGRGYPKAAKKAVYAGAKVVANAIRERIEALPEDENRYLNREEYFEGVPPNQKQDLLNALGVTPIKVDESGVWSAKIGFDGYGSTPTKKYPKGVPNALLARSVESGSSVRKKTPFVRPAVNRSKKAAEAAMEKVIDEEFNKL